METFSLYLLKSAVWLTGFTLVFLTVLRNERYFQLNRIYLLSGIIASIAFPFYTWHYAVIIPSATGTISISGLSAQVIESQTPEVPIYFWFYAVGIGWLAFRLIWQTGKVIRKLRKAGYEVAGPVKLVRTPDYAASFSFFSYVFVNPSTSDVETREIVNHESEHIEQRHWLDLLLVEILCMLQWFNPFVWVYAHQIRQNHEYLADEKALLRTSDPAIYQATLLNQLLGVPVICLANSFSYSLNKKRFKMMKKSIHSPFRKLRLLLVLPLMALVFYAFAKPEYKTSPFVEVNTITTQLTKLGKIHDVGVLTGRVVTNDGEPLPGTSVVIKGTTTGTTTDRDGNFKLAEVPADGELVFSFVGYETKLVKPDFGNPLVVKMNSTTISVEKVTVLGNKISVKKPLYIVNGTLMTESIAKAIDPDKIESVNVLKGDQAISKYGDMGNSGAIEITLKERVTLSAIEDVNVVGYGKTSDLKTPPTTMGFNLPTNDLENPPLYVIDGTIIEKRKAEYFTEVGGVESVNVLKGKTATDKYGDQGKNGVVELTLKKGVTLDVPAEKYFVGYPINSHLKTPHSLIDFNSRTNDSNSPPLYILDGVMIDKAKMNAIKPETIESINVLKDKTATDKYGEKAKDGVVEIKLKGGNPDKYANKKSDFDFVDSKTNDTIRMSAYGSMVFESGKKDSPALYILDGKVKDISEINKIDPESINYITHLQGNDAIKKYGEKGKHGVIVIVTKKNPGASTDVEPKKANLFTVVEEMPQFVGGFNALMKFIGDNIQYPAQAKADKTEGTVIVNFVIKNNGKVENVKIDRGINPLLDKEAARVISILPEWIPGKQQGKAVDVSYTIPIQFKLDGNEQKKPVGLQKQSNEPYKEVEEMPQFPGGENALMHFILEQVRYPKQAMLDNVTGKVLVNFIVTASGKIDRIKIAQGIRQDLDNEALRVIGLMPDWQPGKQDGKAVDVTFTIPIQFKLEAPDPNAAVVRPQFPGIENELTSFIANHVKYPEQAKKDRIEGTVAISFIVKTSGKIENIKVVRSVNPDLDAEAIRVVSLMPDWKPGTVNGKEANMGAYIPIQFKLK